ALDAAGPRNLERYRRVGWRPHKLTKSLFFRAATPQDARHRPLQYFLFKVLGRLGGIALPAHFWIRDLLPAGRQPGIEGVVGQRGRQLGAMHATLAFTQRTWDVVAVSGSIAHKCLEKLRINRDK